MLDEADCEEDKSDGSELYGDIPDIFDDFDWKAVDVTGDEPLENPD